VIGTGWEKKREFESQKERDRDRMEEKEGV
jgi:hypothetical protein